MTARREFLKKSLAGTAGIAIGGIGFSAKSYASIIGANDRINLAIIGIRNQGSVHIRNYCKLKDSHNVQIKTLCDTDEELFESRSKMVEKQTGIKPVTEWDLLKVLDDSEIDAVSIVTPNHWHALATVWACQAGKHVYVEKPASHNIWEGRKMVEAARKYGVRVQVGLNSRSAQNVREAIQFLHEGGIGEVYMARGLCYKPRDSYGVATPAEPPAGFHYERWLGPAQWRPYSEKRSHYCWHWYWDTGNGDTGNTGPHQLDIARWGLAKNEHPVSIFSDGGLYGFKKSARESNTPGRLVYGDVEVYGNDMTTQETPNTQTAVFKYADGTVLEFETRGRYTNQEGFQGTEVGNIFYGSEGYLEIYGYTWRAFHERGKEPFAGAKEDTSEAGDINSHYANFIDGIRSGSDYSLHADINEGYMSACLPLLANISYRVGKQLKFNGTNEKFVNDPEADGLLTRNYREPYVVPEEV
ncbi:MAG: Gfo/Idh/MocA family oxidoreductase [Mariniphaga sp.]